MKTEYMKYRAKGIPARLALSWVRETARHISLDWEDDCARWDRDGFSLVAKKVIDEYPDLSWIGEFKSSFEDGAMPHDQGNARTFDWFVPYPTEEQHYRELRRLKYGRGEARELARRYVHEDYRRMCAYGNDWCMFGVVVTARKNGIELGSASLWGIESDSDEDYFDSVALELATEALAEARSNVKSLCNCH